MARKTFYKRKYKTSQTTQLYLILVVFVFLFLLVTTQCGLYTYKPGLTIPKLPSKVSIYQVRAQQIITRLNQGLTKRIDFEKLNSLIKYRMKEVLPTLFFKSTLPPKGIEMESCRNLFFNVKKRSGSQLLLAFPAGSRFNLSSLYTSLTLAETIAQNNPPYQVAILIYDDSPFCNDVKEALEDLEIPVQFSASITFYPSPFRKDFLNISSGSYNFSSLVWKNIIPIKNDMHILKAASIASSPFFDSPSHGLMKAGIPSIAVGYADKNIFSLSPLKLALASIERFFREKSDISNGGPWLSRYTALKSGFIWVLVLLSLVIIGIEVSETMSRLNQRLNFIGGLVSAFYFGIPVMVFFISIRLFSLNENISQAMTFISVTIAILAYYFLNKLSTSFLNVRENTASLILVCSLLMSILIWNRPFFSFAIIPFFITLVKAQKLSSPLYWASIFISLIPMAFFLVQPYDLTVMQDFLFDPVQINKNLSAKTSDIIFNSFTVGAFISLATRDS